MLNDDFAEEDWADVSADLEAMDRQDDESEWDDDPNGWHESDVQDFDEPCRCGSFDCPECGDGTLPEFDPDDDDEFEDED